MNNTKKNNYDTKNNNSNNNKNNNKKYEDIIRNYIHNLNETDLRYLDTRLKQRFIDDLAECLNLLSTNKDMDRLLSSARTAYDLYDFLDIIEKQVDKEIKKRYE